MHSYALEFQITPDERKKRILKWLYREKKICRTTFRFSECWVSNHVFNLAKNLFRLKQTPKVWYEKLSKFLLDNTFTKEKFDLIISIHRTCENDFY